MNLKIRNQKRKFVEIVKECDSFPKMPSDYKQYTGIGGLITVFMYLFMLWLILSEILYFYDSRIYYKFIPDVDFHDKLKITVDITVAMKCEEIGADIVDVTNQEARKFGRFNLENTWFELSPNQKVHFEEIHRLNSYLKKMYHSLRHILWKAGYTSFFAEMPPRTETPSYPYDACRITGELDLNKVAGNFHITLGKSMSVPGGHIHLQQFFPFQYANFSHRIDKFYFGDLGPGILHPLDSQMKISTNTSQIFKYFIEVISTDIDTSNVNIKTYQYSVKELTKFTNDESYDLNGIFFKYDMTPLKILIREEEYTFLQLIIKIFSCAGGLFIVAGFITSLIEMITRHHLEPASYSDTRPLE